MSNQNFELMLLKINKPRKPVHKLAICLSLRRLPVGTRRRHQGPDSIVVFLGLKLLAVYNVKQSLFRIKLCLEKVYDYVLRRETHNNYNIKWQILSCLSASDRWRVI
jgi:hypothetical protein